MKTHLEPNGARPAQDEHHAKSTRERVVERRRRFLLGGLSAVPTIVTLANRPALATGGRVCTVSAALSGNASRPLTGRCGSSPGCWKNHALRNNASSWTYAGFSPNQLFISVFPMLNTAPWSVSPSNATMLQALNGQVTIKVRLTDGSKTATISNFSSGFPLQICAAILNAGFFGTPAYPLTVQGVKNEIIAALASCKTSGSGATSSSNQSTIRNKISALTAKFDSYIVQDTECPVLPGV